MPDRKQAPSAQARGGQARPPASAGGRGAARRGAGGEARQRPRPEAPEAETPPPSGPRPVPRLRIQYEQEVRPALMREFGYSNPLQAPKVEKVVINIGMGSALKSGQSMDSAIADLETITGQRPVVTRAKRSIAAFKVRQNDPIGCMVTLRGARMYDFLDKLFNVALPRVRDFSGVSPDSFDGRGNYSLGLREQLIFPEVEYDKIERVRGLEVSIVTTARTDEEGRRLLQLLGAPFRTDGAEAPPVAGRRRGRAAS
jgi:large subunit ribosomal protein L5